ncbi:cytochrome P450 [Kitasatospora sp. NPDC051984]|uniref:cytochrome P450 n=1 Tax=Kitasatospora sp. NPDC051984 TaxID=3364059 RepID=UPI0037C8F508
MASPFSDPAFYRDRYPVYAALRQRCPVARVPMGGSSGTATVVTSYDQARAALADLQLSKDTNAFFADRPSGRALHPALASTMLNSDPPDHTRLRRLVTRAFTPARVQQLRPAVRTLAEELVDGWSPGDRVDLMEGLAVPLPITVICRLLGVPAADHDRVRRWSLDLLATGDHERIDAASHALAEYMAALAAAKRTDPDEALLSALVSARGEDGDGLSELELVSLAVLLLVAGHETTTAAIGNSVLALLQHPDQLALLRSDPGRIPAAVDELLRYDSPVSIATWRWAPKATRLGEAEVPAGSPVFVSPGAANRDPDRFTDPDRLDLDRPDAGSHLAFGHGIHRCLGAPLAQAEIETVLLLLLDRFPGLQLTEPAAQLAWRHSRLVRGLEALPVQL